MKRKTWILAFVCFFMVATFCSYEKQRDIFSPGTGQEANVLALEQKDAVVETCLLLEKSKGVKLQNNGLQQITKIFGWLPFLQSILCKAVCIFLFLYLRPAFLRKSWEHVLCYIHNKDGKKA